MPKYTKYPNRIDDTTSLPLATDLITLVKSPVVNALQDAILAIESEMGVNPSGTFATIRDRLDSLSTGGGGGGGGSGFISISKDSTVISPQTTTLTFSGDVTVVAGAPHQAVVTIGGSAQQAQEKFTPTNGQSSFTLTNIPIQATAVEMFLNGLKQQYGTDYTVSGKTVSYFGIPLVSTDKVDFWYLTNIGFFGTPAGSLLLPIQLNEYGVAGVQNTTNTIFTSIGAFQFDPSVFYSGSNIQRDIWFETVIESSTSPVTTTVQLYDVTAGAYITNSLLSTTNTTSTYLASTVLTIPGDLPNISQLYEVHIKRTGGTGSDVAICKMARLVIRYTSLDVNASTTAGTGFGSITTVKTSLYTAILGDLVRCNPTAGGFAVNLPAATGNANKTVMVKNVTTSVNTITIAASGFETIDGVATISMNLGFESFVFVSDGSNWMVV